MKTFVITVTAEQRVHVKAKNEDEAWNLFEKLWVSLDIEPAVGYEKELDGKYSVEGSYGSCEKITDVLPA